jgi:hypothetical protein
MPTVNLGRVGFVNKGNYVGGVTAYKINDIVQYGTVTYACIQAHSVEHLPTDVLYWQKWTDYGIHQVTNIASTAKSTADSVYLNTFSGAQTGVISLKITGLVTATAATVDMNYMEVTITQDDRDHTLGTNPSSYKFMIKGDMDTGVWYNTQAVCLGANDTTQISVRFTRTATDAYIEIGDVGFAWNYPTIEVSHVTDYIIAGYTKVFIATLQNSVLGTTTDSIITVIPHDIAPTIHNSTAKATPIDADEFLILDSATSFGIKKYTGTNLKAYLKTYNDTLYATPSKQIQSITASVSANALTATLNATSLDFRSSSIGSGTVNNRTVVAPISLVIPSGATLGTVNAIQSQLVLIAIDNAGTVELAIVNLAGGNNLDETTLINTTAISGASNAANVIYSTTARTGVPFRVVGFIYITEATAGTWATAPSTIQGIGGQALAALSAIGYGQTWQDMTGSRVNGTTYTNTTGKPIQIMIVNSAANGSLTLGGVSLIAANIAASIVISAIIPNGVTYMYAGTILRWAELR